MSESAAVLTRLIHHLHELSLLHRVRVLFVQILHELELVIVFVLLLVLLVFLILFGLVLLLLQPLRIFIIRLFCFGGSDRFLHFSELFDRVRGLGLRLRPAASIVAVSRATHMQHLGRAARRCVPQLPLLGQLAAATFHHNSLLAEAVLVRGRVGINLAHSLLIHELIVVHCQAVMLDDGDHLVVLRLLRAVERGHSALIHAALLVVLAAIVARGDVHVQELAVGVVPGQDRLEGLVDLLVFALLFVLLTLVVLIAPLARDQAAELGQHVLLIDLLGVPHGAHGYHGLASAIRSVFVDGGCKSGRPRTANGECTALLAMRLGLGRLEQDKPRLRLIVVRVRRVLARVVTLQGRSHIARSLELDASRVLGRLHRGCLERLDLALVGGHRRALTLAFDQARAARVIVIELVIALVFDHSVDLEPLIEGLIDSLSIGGRLGSCYRCDDG